MTKPCHHLCSQLHSELRQCPAVVFTDEVLITPKGEMFKVKESKGSHHSESGDVGCVSE